MLFMLAFMCTTFISCGKDDSPEDPIIDPQLTPTPTPTPTPDPNPDPNFGADNFTDVAVTGGVDNVTATTATLFGYVNLSNEQLLMMGSSIEIGIEISKTESMENASKHVSKALTNNRKLTINVNELLPANRYFYRTYVVNGGYTVVGSVLSFKTENVNVGITIKGIDNLTPHTAIVTCGIDDTNDSPSTYNVGIAVVTDQSLLTAENFRTWQTISSHGDKIRLFYPKSINGKEFEVSLTDLTQNMTHYCCVFRKVDTSYALDFT